MKKKNGFTLIELLAVIVILAVIALIAVPRIIEILNKSRLSAAEDSTYGIVEAAESYIANFMLQNQGALPSSDILFNCSSEGCKLFTYLDGYNVDNLEELKFKGTKPEKGIVTISNNGQNIFTTNLEINGFTCNYINNQVGCTTEDEIKYFQDANVVYFNPETGKQCDGETDYQTTNSDNEHKTDCMKWYLYSENEKLGTVDMLLDHNTTATVAWNSQNNNQDASEIIAQLKKDTKSWQDNLNIRLITADEIVQIVDPNNTMKFDSRTKDINEWFYFHDLSQNTATGQGDVCVASGCRYAWLYDRTANYCKKYGCLNNSNVASFGYWTLTIVNQPGVWFVGLEGRMDDSTSSDGGRGVRPVITIPKILINN